MEIYMGPMKMQKKAFTYKAPDFKKKMIEYVSLDYLEDSELLEKHEDYIKKNNLDDRKADAYVDNIRSKELKEKILDSLSCAVNLVDGDALILRYENKETYVNSGILFNGTIIKSQIKGITFCESSDNTLLEGNYFENNYNLELIDQVTLDYDIQGSNHFVIGVTSTNLYYYTFKIGEKILKFKSPYEIKEISNFDNEIILEMGYEKYRFTTKK